MTLRPLAIILPGKYKSSNLVISAYTVFYTDKTSLKFIVIADELTMVSLKDSKLVLGQTFGGWHFSIRPAEVGHI